VLDGCFTSKSPSRCVEKTAVELNGTNCPGEWTPRFRLPLKLDFSRSVDRTAVAECEDVYPNDDGDGLFASRGLRRWFEDYNHV
jgi:hypothetical protein